VRAGTPRATRRACLARRPPNRRLERPRRGGRNRCVSRSSRPATAVERLLAPLQSRGLPRSSRTGRSSEQPPQAPRRRGRSRPASVCHSDPPRPSVDPLPRETRRPRPSPCAPTCSRPPSCDRSPLQSPTCRCGLSRASTCASIASRSGRPRRSSRRRDAHRRRTRPSLRAPSRDSRQLGATSTEAPPE